MEVEVAGVGTIVGEEGEDDDDGEEDREEAVDKCRWC